MEKAIAVIDQHIPYVSNKDELELNELRYSSDVDRFGQERVDAADLALRTCSCGVRVDGFYEYIDHLKDELRKAAGDG